MLRVVTIFDGLSGLPGYCNMFFGGSGGADAEEVSDRVQTFWAALAASQSNQLNITTEPDVWELEPASGVVTDIHNPGGITVQGTSNAEPIPTSSQLLVRLRTAALRNNRLVQGRFNIPGTTSVAVDDGLVGASVVSGITVAANTLVGNGPTVMGVWSRPTPGGSNGQLSPVAAASCWNQFSVLRSRRD